MDNIQITNKTMPSPTGRRLLNMLCNRLSVTSKIMTMKPTNHTESWEEEFDKFFNSKEYDISDCSYEMHIKQIKSFISQELQRQREEMVEKLRTVETTCPICLSKKCNHIIQENKMVYVEDVLRLLEQS